MSTISPRWVGSSVPAPKENGPSPVGRQRHYGAVELAGAIGQVNVNDVVEVDGGGSGQHQPRLVQVLCMWEDTFTGACKFRARCLVYAADLPQDALARLQEARRAFPDEIPAGSDVARRHSHENKGKPRYNKDGEGFDADEVFLTADREELDVVRIVKPVTLSVGAATDESTPKEKPGPRLTHSFDASSGDFTPVEHSDAIAKRAKARRAEAVVRASRLAEETAAASNGKPVVQSSGWLLPRQKATAVPGVAPAKPGGNSTPTSVADSESEGNISDSSGPVQKALKPDDMEWEKEEGESDGDSDGDSGSDSDSDPTDTKCQQLGNHGGRSLRARTSSRLRKPRAGEDVRREIDQIPAETRQSSSSSSSASSASPLVTPVVTPPAEGVPPVLRDTTVKHQEPTRKRPRRLAMPPIKEKPAAVAAVATRQSKRRPSIAGERKRGRPARATMEGAERYDSPPRRIVVGDHYQADIPDLLSAKEQKKAAVPPAPGTGAKMVWRSIRKWDPQSRGMLSAYFDAAKEVIQKKQARSGVAVHVRLGGGNDNCSDESRHRRHAGSNKNDLTSSYAVWAVNSGSSPGGDVRVACSAMAQTAIPASAIQRVQSEEEALAALVKARCTLDAFEPALQVLEQELPESIEPWTLSQVRTLEQALEKDFDPDRRLHGWAREGMSMDRDDFIDLAHVSKQVPGKTSAQVLSFYYRYLAAAKPLTDVVYGTEAAKARQLEAILPACGNEARPRRDSNNNNLTPAAKLARAGWQTNSPASRNGMPEARDSLATPSKPKDAGASPQPSPSTTKRPRAESRDGNQAAHTLPPPKRCTPALAPGSSRESAVAVDSHRAHANGELRSEYERRRGVPRGQHASRNTPADVEMLEATDFGGGARDGCGVPRSTYPGPPVSAPARASYPTTEARALHPRPRLVAPIDSAPASYGYHAEAAVPSLVGRSPQRRPVSHNSTPFRRELVGDDGRDHRHMVNGIGVGVGGGGGSGGGFSRHDVREDGRPEGGLERGDEFGFMAPCWRLLEMAKSFLDQDQLLYMRGLIATHVRKPMTRQQLLERADSCLQDQQEVLAAFVKMFDRVDHARAEAQLVPLYQAVKRTRAVQAEPVSMMSHNERLSASTAVHTNARARTSFSSYSRSPALPRTYEAPPLGRATGGHPGREEVFSRAAPPEGHPRFVAPGTEAHHQRSMMSDRGGGGGISSGWWREGDSTRSAPPYARGAAAPAPSMYSPAAPSRSAMSYREERRDRDFDIQGEVMRAWPQHQHQDGSGQWRTGGAASAFSGAAVAADIRAPRLRVPWGSER